MPNSKNSTSFFKVTVDRYDEETGIVYGRRTVGDRTVDLTWTLAELEWWTRTPPTTWVRTWLKQSENGRKPVVFDCDWTVADACCYAINQKLQILYKFWHLASDI